MLFLTVISLFLIAGISVASAQINTDGKLLLPDTPVLNSNVSQISDTSWRPISYFPVSRAPVLIIGAYIRECDYSNTCPDKGSELIESRTSGDTITLTWSFREICCISFRAESEMGNDSTIILTCKRTNTEWCNCICCYKMKYVIITKKDLSGYHFVHKAR
jgi:hypothetical protein